jgi:PST family polysaccharide transporter
MPPTLKQEIARGVGWSTLGQLVQQTLSLTSLFVLGHLLTPEDYGIVGMVTIFSGFAVVLVDVGFNRALIQQTRLLPEQTSTVFWLGLGVGGVVFLLMYGGGGVLAWFYGVPELKAVCHLVAVTFLLIPLGGVHRALLTKRMAFKSLAFINVTALGTGVAVAIVMALRGGGYWSLVVNVLVQQAVIVLLAWWREPWRPRFVFRPAVLGEIIRFGMYLSGSVVMGYWSRYVDQLLIGALAGKQALGLYSRSSLLMLLPIQQVAARVDAVLFPAFSRIQDDKARIAAIYLKMTRLVALVTFPMMFGLVAVAADFVPVALGEQWRGMIPLVRLLAPLGAVQSILTMGSSLYLSFGRTDIAFRVSVIVTCANSLVFFAGLKINGVYGLAAGYLMLNLLMAPWIYHKAASLAGLGLRDMFWNLWHIAVGSWAMAAGVCLLGMALPGLPPLLRLALSVFAGALSYLAMLRILRAPAYHEVLALVRQRLGRFRAP